MLEIKDTNKTKDIPHPKGTKKYYIRQYKFKKWNKEVNVIWGYNFIGQPFGGLSDDEIKFFFKVKI